MREITAVNNSMIQYLKTLHKSKNRYQNQQFLVEGWHLVEKALQEKLVLTIFIISDQLERYQKIIPKDINIILINEAVIKKITQEITPQGIIALCKFKSIKEQKNNQNDNVFFR